VLPLPAYVSTLFYVSKLSLQSVKVLAQATYHRQKAQRIFHKTLLRLDIPEAIAKELTHAYPNPIKDLLSVLNLRRRPFR
jgi:hypothetical protein